MLTLRRLWSHSSTKHALRQEARTKLQHEIKEREKELKALKTDLQGMQEKMMQASKDEKYGDLDKLGKQHVQMMQVMGAWLPYKRLVANNRP